MLDFVLFKKEATPFVNYANKSVAGQGFRYPSPATRGEARTPVYPDKTSQYDTQYYTRDTRRNKLPVYVTDNAEVKLIPGDQLPVDKSSPGNKNPAVLRYDASGTRSAMTTTKAAMLLKLDAHRPDHLPTPHFLIDGSESLEEEAARKNIPALPGRPLRLYPVNGAIPSGW